MKQSKKRLPAQCAVVATAHSARGLREAVALRPGKGIDLVEVRVDSLVLPQSRLRAAIAKIRLPVIITVRDSREGGVAGIDKAQRTALYETFLPQASFVDVELRNAKSMKDVLARAKRRGVGIILSFHDFARTPAPAHLSAKLREGVRHGADIVKIATKLKATADLAALIAFQSKSSKVAAMGMGWLGKVSRVVLPMVGARLVYGYLDRPQVDGQWSAKELAAFLGEVSR